ncbi:GYD domain-containing protein [candidate division KSB1 bacterium]
MPTYITLLSYTQKGIENIKDAPSRLDNAKKVFHEMGAKIKAFYLVMGQYDAVVIAESPDDETIARVALTTSSRGDIHTETLRAFTEEEYRRIVDKLP